MRLHGIFLLGIFGVATAILPPMPERDKQALEKYYQEKEIEVSRFLAIFSCSCAAADAILW